MTSNILETFPPAWLVLLLWTGDICGASCLSHLYNVDRHNNNRHHTQHVTLTHRQNRGEDSLDHARKLFIDVNVFWEYIDNLLLAHL